LVSSGISLWTAIPLSPGFNPAQGETSECGRLSVFPPTLSLTLRCSLRSSKPPFLVKEVELSLPALELLLIKLDDDSLLTLFCFSAVNFVSYNWNPSNSRSGPQAPEEKRVRYNNAYLFRTTGFYLPTQKRWFCSLSFAPSSPVCYGIVMQPFCCGFFFMKRFFPLRNDESPTNPLPDPDPFYWRFPQETPFPPPSSPFFLSGIYPHLSFRRCSCRRVWDVVALIFSLLPPVLVTSASLAINRTVVVHCLPLLFLIPLFLEEGTFLTSSASWFY